MGNYGRLIAGEFDPYVNAQVWLTVDSEDRPAGVIEARSAFDAIEQLPLGHEVISIVPIPESYQEDGSSTLDT